MGWGGVNCPYCPPLTSPMRVDKITYFYCLLNHNNYYNNHVIIFLKSNKIFFKIDRNLLNKSRV